MTENQKTGAKIGTAAFLLAAAFAGGRFTAQGPSVKEVVKTEVVEVEKEVIRYVNVEVEKKVYVKGETRDVVREVVIIKAPDGTETTKITETDKTKTTTASSNEVVKTETRVTERESESESKVDKVVVVDGMKAQWHVGIKIGAGGRLAIPAISPVMQFGVSAERRIVGPLWIGLWVDTQLSLPAPGIPPQAVTGGISVALEF